MFSVMSILRNYCCFIVPLFNAAFRTSGIFGDRTGLGSEARDVQGDVQIQGVDILVESAVGINAKVIGLSGVIEVDGLGLARLDGQARQSAIIALDIASRSIADGVVDFEACQVGRASVIDLEFQMIGDACAVGVDVVLDQQAADRESGIRAAFLDWVVSERRLLIGEIVLPVTVSIGIIRISAKRCFSRIGDAVTIGVGTTGAGR